MKFSENIDIPENHILQKTQYSFIFVNIRPFLKYHILVSPIRIVERVYDLNENETNDLFTSVKLATIALKPFSHGFTINIQDGISAGQKIPHVHVHIVPRKDLDLENNDDIYKEGALDCNRECRDSQEMTDEANFLRPFFNEAFKDFINPI